MTSDPPPESSADDPGGNAEGSANASAFFHDESACVRFWVRVDDLWVGATVSKQTLHYRFSPNARDEDPLETYRAHAEVLAAAVRRRVAQGSIEPVMLREHDLRTGS